MKENTRLQVAEIVDVKTYYALKYAPTFFFIRGCLNFKI